MNPLCKDYIEQCINRSTQLTFLCDKDARIATECMGGEILSAYNDALQEERKQISDLKKELLKLQHQLDALVAI